MEKRDRKGCMELNLGNRVEVCSRRLYGIAVIVKENVKLKKGEPTMVKVNCKGKGVKANCMLYMNGISESYRLKRVAEVFNGIFNEENPMVCVHVRLDIQKERIRGVEVGDVVGRL